MTSFFFDFKRYRSILQSVVRVFRDSVDAEEDSDTNRQGLVGKGGEEENLKVWQGTFRKTTSSTGQRGARSTTMMMKIKAIFLENDMTQDV